MNHEQSLQLLLVGFPVLSLIGMWMSLRIYGRLKERPKQKSEPAKVSPGSEEHPQ